MSQEWPQPPPDELQDPWLPDRLRAGGDFLFTVPETVPAIWGKGGDVLWSKGEALMIVGPSGVGKTTLVGQLVEARIGLARELLELPVEPATSKVLYLAMDRPHQIARALSRTFRHHDRDEVNERLTFWQGPPVVDVAKHPETLVGLARLAGAETLIVDSLKDAAIGLKEDEVGAGYNRARQMCLVEGVELVELHHQTKYGPNGTKPTTLADVYGSAWITAGAGSVVLLWGKGGDPIVELSHLKQPADEVGPLKITHDHLAGRSSVWHQTDILSIARLAGARGVTARGISAALFSTERPSEAELEKARRRLVALAKRGELVEVKGAAGTKEPSVWFAAHDPTHDPTAPSPPWGITQPTLTPRLGDDAARDDPTGDPTDPTGPLTPRSTTPVRGGTVGSGREMCDECSQFDHSTTCSRKKSAS